MRFAVFDSHIDCGNVIRVQKWPLDWMKDKFRDMTFEEVVSWALFAAEGTDAIEVVEFDEDSDEVKRRVLVVEPVDDEE